MESPKFTQLISETQQQKTPPFQDCTLQSKDQFNFQFSTDPFLYRNSPEGYKQNQSFMTNFCEESGKNSGDSQLHTKTQSHPGKRLPTGNLDKFEQEAKQKKKKIDEYITDTVRPKTKLDYIFVDPKDHQLLERVLPGINM